MSKRTNQNKNNLILTKRDLTLLHKSEEVKNVDIYGNLYECLQPYTILSEKDLLNDIVFDTKARMTLTHNRKSMMSHIEEEWYAKSSFLHATTEVHCQLCGAKNIYVCYITNRLNGEELHVGSDCIKHFKDINGVNMALTKLQADKRDISKDARRSDFDAALGNYIDFTKISQEKFETFPVLLPYKLHLDMKNTIVNCNRIRTSYVTSGGNLNDCINKFHIKIKEFNALYQKAQTHYTQNKNNPLICTREIANWLDKNNPNIIIEIQKANGILTENTLQFIYEPNFVQRNLSLFSQCLKNKDVTFLKVNGSVIRCKIQNNRFIQPIYFTVPIQNFMKNIGCHCLIQNGYRFDKINLSPSIENNPLNVNNILNYVINVLNNTNYTIILEDQIPQLYWEKKPTFSKRWSTHIRNRKPLYKAISIEKILNIMSQLLFIDTKSESEISQNIISKMNMSGKWISKEEKDRNVQIVAEAAGMQKQREFIPYA